MISKAYLLEQYSKRGNSAHKIATQLNCSDNTVTYWLHKHNITKRTISEALYIQLNPNGDPFNYKKPSTDTEWFLYGLGVGLFWGEGNKVNKNSVRLGNTDVDLIIQFLNFLITIYNIDQKKLRFGLQLFTDIPRQAALQYWSSKLHVSKNQFQKIVVTKSKKTGTYRRKSKYGVLTVYFSNTKLRDIIISAINELREKPS